MRVLLAIGTVCRLMPAVCCALVWSGVMWAEATEGQTGPSEIRLIPVVTTGLEKPLFLTHSGDGSGRLLVVEQGGKIKTIEGGKLLPVPFLDLADRVLAGGERGLLGLAFHPDYRHNGRFFVNYTRKDDGATVLAEFRSSGAAAATGQEEQVLMVVPQPFANHNGGMVAFGPDGYLYIGRGDGGSAGDPGNRAQNPQELLGKILRIDVDRGEPYGIPSDNPYVKDGGRSEVYAIGMRNPWRFSFDRENGDLWVADVGQHKWEEIDRVVRGGNYGWRVMEGRHCYHPTTSCEVAGLIPPVAEYGHSEGRCSITGGYVYRGKLSPSLRGHYLFGDYCSGEVFGLKASERASDAGPEALLKTAFRISSFGEDEAGEVYLVDHGGGVYRLLADGGQP